MKYLSLITWCSVERKWNRKRWLVAALSSPFFPLLYPPCLPLAFSPCWLLPQLLIQLLLPALIPTDHLPNRRCTADILPCCSTAQHNHVAILSFLDIFALGHALLVNCLTPLVIPYPVLCWCSGWGGVRPRQPRFEMDLSLSSGKWGQGEYGGGWLWMATQTVYVYKLYIIHKIVLLSLWTFRF